MTSVGELLDQVQRQAWDLAQDLPADPRYRKSAAKDIARAQMHAWPALAAVGARALRATWSPDESYLRFQGAIAALELTRTRTPPPATSDPRLTRLIATLGAAADLVPDPFDQPGSQEDLAAYRDKLGAILEAVARLTRGYVEASGITHRNQAWRRRSVFRGVVAFADAMENATTTSPGHRAGALDDLGVPDPESDLQTAVAAWRGSARHHLTPRVAVDAPRLLQAFAFDAALISRALASSFATAGVGNAIDPSTATPAATAFAAAAKEWQQAGLPWNAVRGGVGGTDEQVRVGEQLHRAIAGRFRDTTGWVPSDQLADTMDLPQLAQLAGEARWISEQLANATDNYSALILDLVNRGAVLVPAAELRSELRESKWGTAPAMKRISDKGYVPVPKSMTTPTVRDLLTAARAAKDATAKARAAGATTSRVPADTWPTATSRAAGVGLSLPPYWSDPPSVSSPTPTPPARDELDEAREAAVRTATRNSQPDQRVDSPPRQPDTRPPRHSRT